MTARGRSIKVTLIFSLRRHRQVMRRTLPASNRLVAGDGDPSRVHSVASFFVSRVDTETDRRLDELGRADLKGRLGIANARLAYQQYKMAFAGERWQALAVRGATKQRCLWASMSTKDPAYRDTLYVEELIGPQTIATMPEETIRAFQDHGRVERRLESSMMEARLLPTQLDAAGVDYDDVVATLEREGIEKFVGAFGKLLEGIIAKRPRSGDRRMTRATPSAFFSGTSLTMAIDEAANYHILLNYPDSLGRPTNEREHAEQPSRQPRPRAVA